MKHLATFCLSALLGLSSCDLSEAERMDLSRSGVGEIACANPDVRFAGSDSIPLTVLLQASYNQGLSKHFELVWKDLGTVTDWNATVEARLGAQVLYGFSFVSPTADEWLYQISVSGANWLDAIDSITFTLSPNLCRDAETRLNLRVYDDRPNLSIQIRNDVGNLRNGDTLQIDLKNESLKDTLLVGSDYARLRMLGDYLVTLPPRAKGTMKWLVLASSGQSGWVDLSWGNYGQARRIDFQTR